jgi:polyvinyl alcohol dehydrogenase (cytochrome)
MGHHFAKRQTFRFLSLATAIVLLPALARSAAETGSNPAPATFKSRCAGCHGDTEGRIPSKSTLAEMAPATVINALTNGIMRPMAIGLSDREIQQIAIYLTGKQPTPRGPVGPDPNLCSKSDRIKLGASSQWNGWGLDLAGTRFQSRPGLSAKDVSRLKVKWTFAYPGSKNGQVTIVGDRLFISSTGGKVYSLNAKTGCVYWRIDTPGSVRTTPVIAKLAASPSGYVVFYADDLKNLYAADALSGIRTP